jgi:hypothetical protein
MPIVWRYSLLPLYRTPRQMNRTMNSTNMHKMTSVLLVVNKKIEQKMLARRWRRVPCENFVEHLGCAMLKVGSRRTWSPVEREARKRREVRRLYPSVAAAVAPARYSTVVCSSLARGGVGEADLWRGGKVEPQWWQNRARWQNRAAPTRVGERGRR